MKAVLVVVLVIVAGGAVYYAVSQASKPPPAPTVETESGPKQPSLAYADPDLAKKGVPAPGEPKWNVELELTQSKGRSTFHFTVTEENGWAANGIYLKLKHHGLEIDHIVKDADPNRALYLLCDKEPLRFNTPLHHTVTVSALDFPEVHDYGTTENWQATVASYSDLTAPKPEGT